VGRDQGPYRLNFGGYGGAGGRSEDSEYGQKLVGRK